MFLESSESSERDRLINSQRQYIVITSMLRGTSWQRVRGLLERTITPTLFQNKPKQTKTNYFVNFYATGRNKLNFNLL